MAQFYYYPGWWEPGPTLEVQISLSEWEGLPELYQEIVKAAAHVANNTMMARYDKLNPESFAEIEANDAITVLPYPEEVMTAARDESFSLYEELGGADADFKTLLDSFSAFRESSARWFGIAEASFNNFAAEG